MSTYTGAVNMSGTDASIIADLIQQLADTNLELSEERDEKEKFKRKYHDAKDEIKELKEREIDEGDSYAINVPSGYGEKVQDNGVDGDEYHAMIQALEKVEEEKKEKNRALFGLVVAQMDVANERHRVAVRDDIIDEKNRIIAEKDRRIEVVTGERDSATATMFRERAAHIKAKDGVTSGRVTKSKSKTARLPDVVADNMSLTLRQKKKDGSL